MQCFFRFWVLALNKLGLKKKEKTTTTIFGLKKLRKLKVWLINNYFKAKFGFKIVIFKPQFEFSEFF